MASLGPLFLRVSSQAFPGYVAANSTRPRLLFLVLGTWLSSMPLRQGLSEGFVYSDFRSRDTGA